MACDGYTKVWELADDEIVGLDGARGTTLRVTRGTLWLTFERDRRDIVLTAGDSFVIDRGGMTLVQAHGRATVCVIARHVEELRLRGERPSLVTRARAWRDAVSGARLSRGGVPYC